MNLFDYINHINKKTLSTTKLDFAKYNKWMVDRYYSYFQDTVFISEEMSKYPNLTKEQHFNFYYEMVDTRNRFTKMFTKKKEDIIEIIKEYYKVNKIVANQYLKMMPTEQIFKLQELYDKV